MSKRHLVRFFLAGLSALLYSKPQVTYCQEDSDKVPLAYILLDASNSMWTRMDNKPKIEIAKEVLSDLIKSLPERINTGLTAFGHRSENDCADIQDLSAIGVMDKNEIERRIQKISPKGKSSLGAAIRHVVEKIRDYDGPKTIILISDGIEDCDFDACTAVQELKEKDSGFKIEVIGLDVESTAASQLACIARESGGGYQHVTRSAQIADTQESLNRNALGQSPAYQGQEYPLRADPLSDKSLAISRGIPTPFMPAVQRGRGKIRFQRENWLLRPFYWRLIDKESGEEVARYQTFEQDELPEGTFILAWRQYEHGSTEIVISDNLTIERGSTTNVQLRTAIRLNVPNWVKPPRFWGLMDIESKEPIVTFSIFETLLAPAGEYELIWRQYEHRAETISFGKIEITPGITNYFSINTSITPNFADWVNDEPYYWGLQDPQSGEWAARFYGSLAQQLVPGGRYAVVYRLSANDSSDSVLGEVDILEERNNQFTIESGIALEKEDKSSPPQIIEFSELDEEDNVIRSVKLSRSLGPMPLKPGRYRMAYVTHNSTYTLENTPNVEEVILKQGELLRINLDDPLHGITVQTE